MEEADNSNVDADASSSKSALRDNIERKGANAYYYAHASKANGPEWDGKAEPRLLARNESMEGHRVSKIASFEYYKSNITTYAFLDEGMKVKLYIDMEGIGEKCTDEDIELDYTETSFCLLVRGYKPQTQCLSFAKLSGEITDATFRRKKDRLVLTLTKEKGGDWLTINDKGVPDHELV